MNDWIDDEDDDFLAAGFGAGDQADESAQGGDTAEPAEQLSELSPDDADWNPRLGFPDPSNSIRIWADEDGNLTKIRVSLSWREKLQGSLSDAFNLTLMYLNNFYRVGRLDLGSQEDEAVSTKEQFSRDAKQRFESRMAELDAQLEQLPYDESTHFDGAGATAADYDGAVKLTLDLHGFPSNVYIEQKWAEEEANASAIARAVMNCYRWAKAKWTPPTESLTERGKLLQERQQLSRELLAMMGNGIAW